MNKKQKLKEQSLRNLLGKNKGGKTVFSFFPSMINENRLNIAAQKYTNKFGSAEANNLYDTFATFTDEMELNLFNAINLAIERGKPLSWIEVGIAYGRDAVDMNEDGYVT